MLRFLTPRNVFLAVFLGTTGLIGFGLVLQNIAHIEPCPMCIMQRYAFAVAGLISFMAFVHNPAGLGRKVYGALLLLAALAGGGVAARQSWIQHFPPKIMDCGPDLDFMVNSFPLGEALPMIFQGAGDCSKVDWRFLGLSIAEWAFFCFAAILMAGIYQLLAKRKA